MSTDAILPPLWEYMRVSEAAAVLGVSPHTLRLWGRNGRLKPVLHPHNGDQLDRHSDREALLCQAATILDRPEHRMTTDGR